MDGTRTDMKRQRFDPAWLGALGLLGFLGFIPGLEPLRLFFLFSLISLFAPLSRRGKATEATASPMPDVPLNVPAQRSGASAFMAKIGLSYALTFLNPIQLAQMLAQALGQLIALVRTRGQLPDAASYVQKSRYTLPFGGEWFTFNGGVTPATSHSWEIIAQRYTYDFVIADGALMRHRGSGEALADYLCYGQALLSPADGEVVSVRDGVRDAPRPGSGWLDILSTDFRGNHVIIKHAEGEYSCLAHLVPGSIAVRKGERIRRGQIIGQCGNSGHSSEPHLHFHVQDHPNFWIAAGVPVRFEDVQVDGRAASEPQFLTRGTQVAALTKCETMPA
jgi:murein DD-endopeptidase MepM/ murein hydrolase activator NlpD